MEGDDERFVGLPDAATITFEMRVGGAIDRLMPRVPAPVPSVQADYELDVPAPVLPSGRRPVRIRRVQWTAARRLDSWRRRKHRRHGVPTRRVRRVVVIPRATVHIEPVDGGHIATWRAV